MVFWTAPDCATIFPTYPANNGQEGCYSGGSAQKWACLLRKVSCISYSYNTRVNSYKPDHIIYLIRGGLAEILCKPKILPLKSAVLEQLQKIEQAADIAGEEGQ